MAQDCEASWWEKAAGHKVTMMGGPLKAPLEMKWAEELRARKSHAARKTSAWFRRSKLTSVHTLLMFQPYSRTVAAHM